MLSPADIPDLGSQVRRRVFWRLMPLLFFLYVINFLDRVNVAYAALEMTRDLNFSDKVFGLGAGIFFAGYLLLEIPGALIVERWSARKWIARIMISWGFVTMVMALVHTPSQFYWARFLLGVAESGFFTGILVYLRHWFVQEDRAKAVALLMAAIPISNIFGSPLAGLILRVHWLGLSGWRWLFILEGFPAIAFGIVVLFFLTDRPRNAKWLTAGERDYLLARLEREDAEPVHAKGTWRLLWYPAVLVLVVSYFLQYTGAFGLLYWLPTIIKRASGLPTLEVTLLVSIPYFVSLVSQIANSWHSDRTRERRWHAAAPMFVAATALVLLATRPANLALILILYSLATAGIAAYLGPFWAHTSGQLRGLAAAAATGSINAIGSVGGFAGPYIVGALNTHRGTPKAGVAYLTTCVALSGLLLLLPVSDGKRLSAK